MFERVADLCAAAVSEDRCPSVSVAVARHGEVIYANAWGQTPDTAYLLASVTKPITATAILLLAERNQLDLDTAVTSYLPDLRFGTPQRQDAPTVRQLLNHTSGLGLHLDFSYDSPAPGIYETCERYGVLFAPPGDRYGYTNLGYGILDELIGVLTGSPAGDFIRHEVFEPLGLRSGHVGPTYDGGPASTPYTVTGKAYPTYDTTHRGASLGWFTAADLALFGQSHAGGRSVLTADSRAGMAAGSGYGLGWVLDSAAGHRTIGHAGAMGGVDTELLVLPESGLSIAVLVNRMWSIADQAVDEVLTDLVPGYTPAAADPVVPTQAPEVYGGWSGAIASAQGDLPLGLDVHPDGSVVLRLGDIDAAGTLRPGIHVPDAVTLGAAFDVQLPGTTNSPSLYLALEHTGGRLRGAARAMPAADDSTGWFGNCLSHWCELSR